MGEGQGPQTEIGSSVRDSSEHEFDGLDELMHEDLTGVMLLVRVIILLDPHHSCIFLRSIDLGLPLCLEFFNKQLMLLVLFFAVQPFDLDDGLRQQHDWHTNHSYQ